MRNLNLEELKSINGGNVPVAYYMDSDVISANSDIMVPWLQIAGRTIAGLGKELMRALLL